jgi:AcrR family transcriptional regulator
MTAKRPSSRRTDPAKAVRRVHKKAAYHHGDLRRALADAALRLIESKGMGAVTLREVARMVGVSHQAPYRHFADRSELLAAVAEEGFRSLSAEMVKQMQQAPDAASAFRTAGITYVVFAVEHPAHFRVMFGADAAAWRSRTPSLAAGGAAVLGLLTKWIAEIKRDMPPGGSDVLDIALTAWSLVHGLAFLLVDNQLHGHPFAERSPRALAELVTDTVKGFGMREPT